MVGSFSYYVFYFIDPKFGGNVELPNMLGLPPCMDPANTHAWNRHAWIQGIQLTMILKALGASRIRHAWVKSMQHGKLDSKCLRNHAYTSAGEC
jgi:hypothetical protein